MGRTDAPYPQERRVGAAASGGVGDGKAGGTPGGEPAGHVGGAVQAEPEQGVGSQRGRVALLAQDDDAPVGSGQPESAPPSAGRGATPARCAR